MILIGELTTEGRLLTSEANKSVPVKTSAERSKFQGTSTVFCFLFCFCICN